MIGTRYQILEELGSGGVGTVFRALDRLAGTHVALKQVNASTIKVNVRTAGGDADAASLDRLTMAREFRVLASLRHPNIISVLDYGFDDNLQPFYTMEVVDQPRTVLEEGRGQPLEVQIDLLIQMLHALEYLHRRGVIHLDVKPSNVLVENRQVRLLDFGLSEMRGGEARSGVSGSIPYLAPEVLQELPVTEAADLYAFGVIAYEMLTGRHPYAGQSVSTSARRPSSIPRLPNSDS